MSTIAFIASIVLFAYLFYGYNDNKYLEDNHNLTCNQNEQILDYITHKIKEITELQRADPYERDVLLTYWIQLKQFYNSIYTAMC